MKTFNSEKSKKEIPTTVLVVEDDKGLNSVIQKNLQQAGFKTEGVFNGFDTIAKVTDNPNLLLLLDYVLPDMTGKELIRTLFKQECSVPFLVMTGHGDAKIAVEMMKLGAGDYIIKDPGFLDVLPQILKKVIENLDKEKRLIIAEKALRESEEKMRTILDSMPDVVLQLDTNLEILWANKATLKLNPHVIGQLCYKALPGRNDECPGCPIVKALKTGETERGIVHLPSVKGIGESYWDNVGVPIKDSLGKITSIVKLARNVTERKKAEEELKKMYTELKESQSQLIQSEKMNAVGTLVAGVAHELNNPLTAMLHFIQYCSQHTSKDDQLYPVLQDIKHETISCIDIIQNLLTFSHMRREGKIFKKENLETIINRVLKLLTYRIMKENFSVTQHSTKGIPDISMNVNNIQQVFLNLISNSMDALEESKKKKISIDMHCDGEYVQTIISDSGCGISCENINNIFDPFFTTKPVGKGTGLGLSLCQSIIKAHNGEITCESVPGEGTKFKILLPAATAKDAKGAKRAKNATAEPQKAQKKEKDTENATAKEE